MRIYYWDIHFLKRAFLLHKYEDPMMRIQLYFFHSLFYSGQQVYIACLYCRSYYIFNLPERKWTQSIYGFYLVSYVTIIYFIIVWVLYGVVS